MFEIHGNTLIRRYDKEILQIEPWGADSFRVRATQRAAVEETPGSALLPPEAAEAHIEVEGEKASIRNGCLTCRVLASGKLRFYNEAGDLILEEYDRNRFRKDSEGFNSALEIDPRAFSPHLGTDNFRLQVTFESNDDERFYGMGQYQHPYLNLKGCVLELAQRNSQASVPFVLSSRGYGLLWNNPAVGEAAFGRNLTRWTAQSTAQMDYWVTYGGTPAAVERAYAKATGTVPMMPDYAMGFWQCKLRYQTQEELLEVAREYKRRNLPLKVIVCDYFHWPHQGDWKFDPDYWPNPKAMVEELRDMGMELMVSIWPTVEQDSDHYDVLRERGMLTRNEMGKRTTQLGNAAFIDPTNPETRKYVWEVIRKNYYDLGIRIFWLDEAEPEYTGYEYPLYRYNLGADMTVGNVYPRCYAQMTYEGMTAAGQENVINLLRCAWAGSQRYGALVWSGDIDSSFRSLRYQLAAGLNMGLAGIPWWTTDIGGFHGGDVRDPAFHELLIRWFEFGCFCPVMRLHGDREPHQPPLGATGGGSTPSGGPNEVWSYGEANYDIMIKYMALRETLRPYITQLMQAAHETGDPVMRPLFYDFPEDPETWQVEDAYLFGPDVLVAPILEAGQTQRAVYLPAGASWRNAATGEVTPGGRWIPDCSAPLERIPVFVREGKLPELQL